MDDIGLYFSEREFHLPTWHPRKNSRTRVQKVQLPDDLPIELCRATRRRNPNYKYARIVMAPLFCWTGRCRVVLSNARVLMRGRSYRSVKATSNELNTGLNIYRMIDFEPVWIWACNTIPGAIG